MCKRTYPRLGRRRREHQSISMRYAHTYNVDETKRTFETKQRHQNRTFLRIFVTEKTTMAYNAYPATRYTYCALRSTARTTVASVHVMSWKKEICAAIMVVFTIAVDWP